MTSVTEYVKWHHVEDYDVVARGDRVGTIVGITREPPAGSALLADVEGEHGTRRIALPLDVIVRIDGYERRVELVAAAERVRSAPTYDPLREAPDAAYLERVRVALGYT